MAATHRQADLAVSPDRSESCPSNVQIDPGDVLDLLAQGVIVTDAKAVPLVTNRVAREIVAEADGLRLDSNGLCAERPQDSVAMRWMISTAAASRNAGALARRIDIARPSNRRPLTLLIAPKRLVQTAAHQPAGGCVVLITDPERISAVPLRLLQGSYGLTPMEAAVAVEIARGDGLRSVAEKLGIRTTTARTHLQQAFRKTGTRRQAQLAWLIAGSCGSLHLESPSTGR